MARRPFRARVRRDIACIAPSQPQRADAHQRQHEQPVAEIAEPIAAPHAGRHQPPERAIPEPPGVPASRSPSKANAAKTARPGHRPIAA
jgi:hypothetical protein